MIELLEKELTEKILSCAYTVHTNLGPGLLEKTYEECFAYELNRNALFVEKQKELPLIYEDVRLEVGYRIDLLIEKKVIIEIKSVEAINDVHIAQILTYLKLSGCRVGFLINFNVKSLKDGIKRFVF
jgi:GxxExxY protein